MSTDKLTVFTLSGAGRLLTGVVLTALVATAWSMTPPAARPADDSPDAFSAERALAILERLIGDEAPHPIGSPANARVRDEIMSEIRSLGLAPQLHATFVCSQYRHYCGTVENILARLPATVQDPADDQAVVINAHYDSQGATPGAADALVGVASALEIGRILLEADRRTRDVVLFFPDGEEAGLLGATAFVESHAWAEDVGAFVNLEARGSGGISIPAYTIGEDGAVLRPYLSGFGRRAPGSGLAVAAGLLPAANDIAVFDRLGVPGVTLGFASNVRHYHTPLDDLEHLDRGSVQQQGDSALRIVEGLLNDDLPARAIEARRTSFVALGPIHLAWPEGWTFGLGLISILGAVFIAALWVRCGAASGRQLKWGLVAWPVTVLVAFFGSAVFNLVRKSLSLAPGVWVSRPEPTFFGFWAGAAVLVGLMTWLFRKSARPAGFWLGGTFWGALAGAILSWFIPGLGYLFVVPTLFAVLAGLVVFVAIGRARTPRGHLESAAYAITALVALLVWLPHMWFLKDFIGLGNMPPVAAGVGIALTTIMPLAGGVRRVWPVIAGSVATTLILLGVGTRVPAFSEDTPQWANVLYALDAEAGTARWLYTGFPIPAATCPRRPWNPWPLPRSRSSSRRPTRPNPALSSVSHRPEELLSCSSPSPRRPV